MRLTTTNWNSSPNPCVVQVQQRWNWCQWHMLVSSPGCVIVGLPLIDSMRDFQEYSPTNGDHPWAPEQVWVMKLNWPQMSRETLTAPLGWAISMRYLISKRVQGSPAFLESSVFTPNKFHVWACAIGSVRNRNRLINVGHPLVLACENQSLTLSVFPKEMLANSLVSCGQREGP